MGEYLTLEEAADRLGVEYKTVYRLVRGGQIPAGKIGRIYRVREEDLDTYFEKQKQAVADQAGRSGLTALEGLQCGSCGSDLVSELSIAGRCEAGGCESPICQACWSIKKVRLCEAHTQVAPDAPVAPKKESPLAKFGFGEKAQEAIARLRAEGKPVVSPQRAALAEESFLRVFAQRLEDIETLPEPLSGATIELRQAKVKHELDGEPTTDLPSNLVSRFVLRSGGWGKAKACLVLEARFLCDLDALKKQGYWAEPIGEEQTAALLGELAREAEQEDCFEVVVIASPTGWTPAAMALVTGEGSHLFEDRRVVVALADLHADRVILAEDDRRLWPYWAILAPARCAEKVAACVEAVRAAVTGKGSLALADACREQEADESWMRDAFEHLAGSGELVVDELDDCGLVISRPVA